MQQRPAGDNYEGYKPFFIEQRVDDRTLASARVSDNTNHGRCRLSTVPEVSDSLEPDVGLCVSVNAQGILQLIKKLGGNRDTGLKYFR
jgi:hypothetical protein